MKTIVKSGAVTIPDGVKVEISARMITVTGPRGKIVRNMKHLPVDITFTSETVLKIDRWFTTGKDAASIRTCCSHINNMIIGVTKVRQRPLTMRLHPPPFPLPPSRIRPPRMVRGGGTRARAGGRMGTGSKRRCGSRRVVRFRLRCHCPR